MAGQSFTEGVQFSSLSEPPGLAAPGYSNSEFAQFVVNDKYMNMSESAEPQYEGYMSSAPANFDGQMASEAPGMPFYAPQGNSQPMGDAALYADSYNYNSYAPAPAQPYQQYYASPSNYTAGYVGAYQHAPALPVQQAPQPAMQSLRSRNAAFVDLISYAPAGAEPPMPAPVQYIEQSNNGQAPQYLLNGFRGQTLYPTQGNYYGAQPTIGGAYGADALQQFTAHSNGQVSAPLFHSMSLPEAYLQQQQQQQQPQPQQQLQQQQPTSTEGFAADPSSLIRSISLDATRDEKKGPKSWATIASKPSDGSSEAKPASPMPAAASAAPSHSPPQSSPQSAPSVQPAVLAGEATTNNMVVQQPMVVETVQPARPSAPVAASVAETARKPTAASMAALAASAPAAAAKPAAPRGKQPKYAVLTPKVLALLEHTDTNYNPDVFDAAPPNARFFVIKSYSEDDVHKSIKKNVWTSTEHGNRRLSKGYQEAKALGAPVYLFFSANGSGHFCGVAEMISEVDFQKISGIWAQEKWKGEFRVRWIFVKDTPNNLFKHIRLENNEMKPVTNSRDAQEVPWQQGRETLAIIAAYKSKTSVFDDFEHYEARDKKTQEAKPQSAPVKPSPQSAPVKPAPQSKPPPQSKAPAPKPVAHKS